MISFLLADKGTFSKASKLGLKQNRYIMSMYDQYQFVQYDSNPLIITVVGGADANTGMCVCTMIKVIYGI